MGVSGWRVIGRSVRGVSHIRAELPNQDSISWWPESGVGPRLIVSVSDGHGSSKSFRSDTGARLAGEAAETVCRALLSNALQSADCCATKRLTETNLARDLVRNWREAVADDLSARPFTDAELRQLATTAGVKARRQVVLDPPLAYGATLLSVVVTELFVVYVQIGDGDILTVSEAGEVSWPLPKDERLLGNETTSLCSVNASRDFRVGFQLLSGASPALITLSTDGYANSFREPAGFLKVASDIWDMLQSDGVDAVADRIEGWLSETSQVGSGDDITLAVICRPHGLGQPAKSEAVGQTSGAEPAPGDRLPADDPKLLASPTVNQQPRIANGGEEPGG